MLPPVYSTTVPPGCNRPAATAPATTARAMRSFMLPVGLWLSSLTGTRAQPRGTTRRSSTTGVLPTESSMPDVTARGAPFYLSDATRE